MDTELFWYHLPASYIAYYPARQRDLARLMVVDRQSDRVGHNKFTEISQFMNPGDGLVINDTKVFKARFIMRRQTGGKVEVFLLEEVECKDKYCWEVLTHPSRRIKEGEIIQFDDEHYLTVEEKRPEGKTVVSFPDKKTGRRIINKFGHVPLPIYIHRPDEKRDVNRYQTIFADQKKDRSVAAPTAGLHFTQRVLKKIEDRGVKIIPITLHVGYGTFKTVKTNNVEEHSVDPEYAEISARSAKQMNSIRKKGGKLFVVGTTSVRTLESAEIVDGQIQPFKGYVDLYIYPGYEFKVVDHLITNFHLPQSSLIFLVSAFAGRRRILEAYDTAIQEQYRFYSYGDCMLIL
jgi:S-adenosylmethionine:tRNA ribosyltransferase-isomerase